MWYIIRHGETRHNFLKIGQGNYPSLLTIKGVEQSKAAGKKLLETGEDFSKYKFIISSTARTKHTAEIIMETLGIWDDPIKEELIAVRRKGIFENVPKKDLKEKFPKELAKAKKDKWNYALPGGGESREDQYQKLLKFIEKYKDEKNLVIVIHKGKSSVLRGILEGKTKEEIKNIKSFHPQDRFFQWNGKEMKETIFFGEKFDKA